MVYVIVPTYNERENLAVLVRKVFALDIPDLKMAIVDDDSPDRTGELAEELAKEFPMKVIHRQNKEGLGKAYVDGFRKVLREKPDYIIQMDVDLSHDPYAILWMLEKIKGCDVVLGSRYVPGGKIENWNWMRRLVSRWGNVYARLVLGVPYKDLTGGFKCWRREVLENIDLDHISSNGYNFQIETTYKAHRKGYKICEIPIAFAERKIGASKFRMGIILESFWKVILLRMRN